MRLASLIGASLIGAMRHASLHHDMPHMHQRGRALRDGTQTKRGGTGTTWGAVCVCHDSFILIYTQAQLGVRGLKDRFTPTLLSSLHGLVLLF